MRLTFNGAQREFEEGLTVAELVEQASDDGDRQGVAVAVDDEVVPRSAWETTNLSEGQVVELVSAIQGG